MKKFNYILSVLVLALVLIPSASAANWTISGDTVSWNNSWGSITAWPHTAKGYNYIQQSANLTWNLAANTLDFAFLFDFPISGNLSVYNPATQSWENKTSLVTHTTYNGQDVYLIPNVAFAQGETKQVKWGYYVPPGSSGKWTLLIKLSSDSIATAYSTGRYLQLDPWWNTTRPFIENKGFEEFPSGSPPTNWTYNAGNQNLSCSSDLVNGSCSVRINDSSVLSYNNTNFDSTFQGKVMEFTALAKTNVSNSARIAIHDGDTGTFSSYAVGNNTWQRLTVTKTLHATLSDRISYELRCEVAAGSNSSAGCLFDEVGWGTVLNLSFDNGVQDWSTYNDSVVLTDVGSQTHPALSTGGGGNARSFNGSGAFVAANHLGAWDFYNGDFSGNVIIRGVGTCGGDKYLFAMRRPNAAGPGFSLACETVNSNIYFETNNGTSANYATTSGINFSNGSTFRLYWEYDAYANQTRLFVNNVLQAFQTHRGGVGANADTGPNVYNFSVGSHGQLTGGFFNFTADEILLRSYRLTAEERTNLYNSFGTPDTTSPGVTINSPANRTFGNSAVWINVTLDEDTGSVIAQINSSINASLTNSSGNWNLLRNNFPDGPHNITIFANDSAGNMNSSETVYFTIDTVFPNVSLLSPANNTLREVRNVNFSFNISDDRALANITIDTSWNSSNTTNSSGLANGVPVAFNFTLLDDGNHTFYAVVSDNASNRNFTANFSIRVDTRNATISDILVSGITDRVATITFTTDRQVNTTVTYGGVSGTYDTNISNSTFGTSQTLSLTGLNASTRYFYRIYTWNLASNFTESAERNFSTTAIQQQGGAGAAAGGGGAPPAPTIINATVTAIKGVVSGITGNVSLFNTATILYLTDDWSKKSYCTFLLGKPDICKAKVLSVGKPYEIGGLVYSVYGIVDEFNYIWALKKVNNGSTIIQFRSPVSTIVVTEPGEYTLSLFVNDSTGRVFNTSHQFTASSGVVEEEPGLISTIGDKTKAITSIFSRPTAPGIDSSPSDLFGTLSLWIDEFFYRTSNIVPSFLKFSATGETIQTSPNVQTSSGTGFSITESLGDLASTKEDKYRLIVLLLLLPLGYYGLKFYGGV